MHHPPTHSRKPIYIQLTLDGGFYPPYNLPGIQPPTPTGHPQSSHPRPGRTWPSTPKSAGADDDPLPAAVPRKAPA